MGALGAYFVNSIINAGKPLAVRLPAAMTCLYYKNQYGCHQADSPDKEYIKGEHDEEDFSYFVSDYCR